jgi:hypothetical protein
MQSRAEFYASLRQSQGGSPLSNLSSRPELSETGRVPQVRHSVPGLKKTGEAPTYAFSS